MKKPSKKKSLTLAPAGTLKKAVDTLLPEIRSLIESARRRAVAAANLSMVLLYWNIGRIISTEFQKQPGRAKYGAQLLERMAESLISEYGRGHSRANLQDMRRFFETFDICQTVSSESGALNILQTVSGEFTPSKIRQPAASESERLEIDFSRHYHLSWSHYRILLGISDSIHRRFYFEQAANQRWSKRELHRRIGGALFERVALSRDTRKLAALEKRKGPTEIAHYRDIFKDPYLLDFLGLKDVYSESDLESAILANLQQFLTELGGEFCFIRRQYPMRIDDDDYFLDLLFYHRGLRCLIAIDLKIGPFTAADKGQMDLYLSWLKRHEWRDGENEPLGLILCASKKRQHVEMLLADGPHKMQVSEYLTQLPDKKVLKERMKMYSKLLEVEE